MAYNYDRTKIARERRHKQRGKAKRRSKMQYRKKRQQIKNKSRRWRKQNKAKVKRYQNRRKANPGMYKMLPSRKASDEHGLFQPEEDIYLLENEIEFWDPSTDTPDVGFVNWIDLDEAEVHTVFVQEDGERFQKIYDLYEFMDVAALMFEEDEEVLLSALDEMHADAEEGEEGG